jgi:hypothetical protein
MRRWLVLLGILVIAAIAAVAVSPHFGPADPLARLLARHGWNAEFKRGEEIVQALRSLDAEQRATFDTTTYRDEEVAFIGVAAPPGGTNDLLTMGGFYLRVVNKEGKDLRPHAVWWEVMIRGTIMEVLPQQQTIVIEVAQKDWHIIQTG